MMTPIFRFAPSPNGQLHLGHALSALVNLKMARETGGISLLRIEDIDIQRCTPELETSMLEDLEWIGFEWDKPPRRQSENFEEYKHHLENLKDDGFLFPSQLSRKQIREQIEIWEEQKQETWPTDPDGSPHYPETPEQALDEKRETASDKHEGHTSLRLNTSLAVESLPAPLSWQETGNGPDGETGVIMAHPLIWGNTIIARKEVPTSYHLSCVVDDAVQGITTVVRGQDLFHATSMHRLLQELLGFAAPNYHHHRLVLDQDGSKLSKSRKDTSLRELRNAGLEPQDILEMIGFRW